MCMCLVSICLVIVIQISVDQYGWQHLFDKTKSGLNLLATPGIQQVVVNPVDDSSAFLTDDGMVLLFGVSAGSLTAPLPQLPATFAFPSTLYDTVVASLTAHCAYWIGIIKDTNDGGKLKNVFAFRSSSTVAVEINQYNGFAPAGVFVVASSIVYPSSGSNHLASFISYQDGSLFATGSALGLSIYLWTQTTTASWGLPASCVIAKFDGLTNFFPSFSFMHAAQIIVC